MKMFYSKLFTPTPEQSGDPDSVVLHDQGFRITINLIATDDSQLCRPDKELVFQSHDLHGLVRYLATNKSLKLDPMPDREPPLYVTRDPDGNVLRFVEQEK